ncbi:MAG: mercury(II) reductase [Chloroflexota bacterium]
MLTHRYHMPVAGMTCPHGEAFFEQALITAGAQDVHANFRRSEVTFTAPANTTANLAAAVREAGDRPGQIRTLDHRVRAEEDGARKDYDLAIIGSGAGSAMMKSCALAAFAAAITAREQGARVAMIERGTLGGTCVNIGCIPSKALIRAAEVYHSAGHHPFEGIETHAGHVDFAATVAQKDRLVARLRQEKYANLVQDYGWDLLYGEARFVDDTTLAVDDRTIRAERILIATDARPALPPIPGLIEAEPLTSTTALALDTVPRSLVIIGAGYVALELGQLFRRLAAEVTLIQRGPRLLGEYEPEVAEAIGAMLQREKIEVLTSAQVQGVERDGAMRRVQVRLAGEDRVLTAEQVLVASGRTPNTESLNLPAAGIQTDARGAVVVDEYLQTTNPRVFAAGDVTGAPQFVYVAAYQGNLAAKNALLGAGRQVDLSALPGVVFTDPQVAIVGMTEAQARAAGHEVKTSVLPVTAVPRALVNYEEIGVFKLVADAVTDQLLGAHIVASNAGDVIYAAVLAVKYRLTVADLVESFAPYLTMAEGLKLSAQAFARDVAKLSCCAA